MKTKILKYITLMSLIIVLFSFEIYADTKVNVTLPDFKVTLNKKEVNNTFRQYPLIVYKGITYFPMTYYDCRFLGLDTAWSMSDGLKINKMNVSAPYNSYDQSSKNSYMQTASIASFNIELNGKAIDNSKEEYPLLLFRDVIYFPMTWKFCVDEFGWKYSFDTANGLVINSLNPAVQKIDLIKFGKNLGVTSKYYVYYGSDGKLYKAPISDTRNYSLIDKELEFEFPPNFTKQKNDIIMSSRYGGASIGGVSYYIINDDGTISLLRNTRDKLLKYDDMILINSYGSIGPVSETLYIIDIKSDEIIYEQFGKNGAANYSGFLLSGRDLYFNAAYSTYDESTGKQTVVGEGLFKSNIDTKEETQLLDKFVQSFAVEGQNVYYMLNNQLHKIDTKNQNEHLTMLDEKQIENFVIIDKNIFYVEKDSGKLYVNTSSNALIEDKQILGMAAENNYLVVRFTKNGYEEKGFAVFDKNGKMLFKSEDDVEFKFLTNNDVYFYNFVKNELYKVELGN